MKISSRYVHFYPIQFPVSEIAFPESSLMTSTLEKEIFGSSITRDGSVNSTLTAGAKPASPITRQILEVHLSKFELFAYDTVVISGDKCP